MSIRQIVKMTAPPIVVMGVRKVIQQTERRKVARKLEGQVRLHLACGKNILDNWANLDLQGHGAAISWDITDGLPVRSGTIELIYSEHFIEHITLEQAKILLADCYRVLRPGGILRLSTPSLTKWVDEYLLGRTSEWNDMGWSPATPCQMVNEGLRNWGHQFVYDADELKRVLEEVGYHQVTAVKWHESSTPALRNLECRPYHGEIILEAMK